MKHTHPKEYTDELDAAFPLAKHDFCNGDNCVVETSVRDEVFLNQCGLCDMSYCTAHFDAHECVKKKQTIEVLQGQPWVADWDEKPGSAFDLLDLPGIGSG